MRILILSDSLTLPRNKGGDQVLQYEETWPSLLQQDSPELQIARVGIGSATTDDILYQARYWTGFNPDITFIQAGLCDALPRAHHRYEVELMKKFPMNKLIRWIVSKNARRFRRTRNITLVSRSEFRRNVNEIASILTNVWWIMIASKSGDARHMPGSSRNINDYNQIIKDVMGDRVINLDRVPEDAFMSDHFHMNQSGHQKLLAMVQESLNQT